MASARCPGHRGSIESCQSECEIAHAQGRKGDASLGEMLLAFGGGIYASPLAERQEAMMNIPESGDVARLRAIYVKLARIAAQMNDPRLAQKRNSSPDGGASVGGNITRSNLVRLVDVIAAQRGDARM
jgi:hypothetical protein